MFNSPLEDLKLLVVHQSTLVLMEHQNSKMRAVILFAGALALLLVALLPANCEGVSHQSRHSRAAPPLHRSSSDTSVNRNHPKYGHQGYGRSRSFDRGDGSCSKNYHVDYLQLTLQWGPGACATSPKHCVKIENQLFTVHGMWPQVKGQLSPEFCCFDNTFYFKEIEPLIPLLNKYWFSYFNQNSRGFWSHEWIKHGTCMRDISKLQGESKFFGSTLDIMKRMDILGTLKKNGVVPGQNKVYSSQTVIDGVRELTGGKLVQIDCDLEAHQPTPLLTGMNLCFDTSLNFIDCPPSKSRCRRDVMFLNQ